MQFMRYEKTKIGKVIYHMDLKSLFEIQRLMDDRIIAEHHLEGQNLLPNTILALQVELGELANEWQGFKHWKVNPQPKYGFEAKIDCPDCQGNGFWYSGERVHCKKCNRTGKITNPLLEEYVDGLSFILQIGLNLNFHTMHFEYLHGHNVFVFKKTTTIEQFNDMFIAVSAFSYDHSLEFYEEMFLVFIGLGELLEFTWEQIEQAYLEKNKINHVRQDNGY